ncbi:MAG: hypothetical protein HFI09_03800, partial [Bacilli bacterium]|nr:hypothetical protein [Bacilli bacterium]
IRSMHIKLYPKSKMDKITMDLQQKSDYQLALIFKKYIQKIKRQGIQRPYDSYISEELFYKLEDLLTNRKTASTSSSSLKDEEEKDLLDLLTSWRLSDFSSKENVIDFPLFNHNVLRDTSFEKLLELFAICSHYQTVRLSMIRSTNIQLGVDTSKIEDELKKVTDQIRKHFYHTGDYFVLLSRHPIIEQWKTKSIEESYKDLIKLLKEYTFKPNLEISENISRMLGRK